MTRSIYALLVGIDEYVSPIPPLQGCVNDIKAMQDYLEGRVATGDDRVHIKTLFNQEATRQAVIEGFRTHLCQATAEDVALFCYSGHGAQEQDPPEFWTIEPDRTNETLVCYDSRSANGWDLADKELAKLIAEVAEKNPHITIVLDCCHSGTGTRDLDVATRQAPIDTRSRPVESFIFSIAEASQLTGTRSLEDNATGWSLPQGRHILLAACREIELAKEYNASGQRRGAFSYFLLDTLKKANGSLSYRDLFKRANALVQAKVSAQSPQLEATLSGDLDQPFLGGAIPSRTPYFTLSHHKEYGWVIDGGAVHGIAQPTADETTFLALFPFDAPPEQLKQLSASLGEAAVTEVMPQLSKVRLEEIENPDTETTFKAVITSLPLPPKGVFITGDESGVELVRKALQEAAPQQQPSLYVREVETPEAADFKLLARNGEYLITRPTDDRPLVAQIQGYSPAKAVKAIERLEHITRWTNIVELSSPANSRIRPDAVQLSVYQNGEELQGTDIRLEYCKENGRWLEPQFKVKLANTSNKPLYCALLDLTDTYAVSAELLASGGVWLQPGEEAWALGGEAIYPTVPQKLWEQGITETRDILKLIVSTAEFDATLLEQDALDLPFGSKAVPKRGKGTLNRLMSRTRSRVLRSKPESEVEYDDWIGTQIGIATVRPLETTPIPQETPITLGQGVTVQGHPQLNAKARLTTVTQATRDLGNDLIPPLLRSAGVQPFQFNTSRGNDPGLSALELSDIENPSVVTPENPLVLELDASLQPNEELLPVSYDGEFFLPLGGCRSTPEGKTEVRLERLSDPMSKGSRSLGGSIRIFFQKIVTQKLGLDFTYPLLAVAKVSPDETVTYETDREQVQARIASAERILLFVHGIIGDTQSMVKSVQRAKVNAEGQERLLIDCYDLVLTFDYENLHTPIEENARLLKQRLEAIGLGENHGKTLHVVAHSMGGLVSRWFIEREGGNQIVQHLIMLGTPNGGSPWSVVEDWALTALSLGLNGLTKITWSVPVVGQLVALTKLAVKAVETIDVSLDQMNPDSDFLKNLASSPEPGIPYTILAGNTALAPNALEPEPGKQTSPLERLMQKLFNRAMEKPFFGQPNDIAVTVKSIKNVSESRTPQPQIQEVGCDHLVYFSHEAGLTALAAAVAKEMPTAQPESPPEPEERPPVTPTPIAEPESSRSAEPPSPNIPEEVTPVEQKESKSWIGVTTILIAVAIILSLFLFQQLRLNPSNEQPEDRQSLLL
ncbi:caspase family protein [Lusitaniella coriacea LEGE 07157]|uniref:Caspase family protein n=1 Tax=Lusitaniella coriacea LEGE 07157 TaxID=945747 RepID=A0A8J7DYG6_9CYAN|nr:caspase family protein [Lusitaniella coriacea]MBE9117676.1 caspase family protein [Lusitaniella coriacea LEGE 07157]